MVSPIVRSLLAVAALVAAPLAHAEELTDTYHRWEALRDPKADTIRFNEGLPFLKQHPGWPEEKTIRLRTEAAALAEAPAQAAMASFCADEPISGRGMAACALAEVGTPAKQVGWVKKAWAQGDFSADEESRLRQRFSTILIRDLHEKRLERLLYEDKRSAAQRMLPLVGASAARIATVRMALAEGDKHAPKLLDTLSTVERRDPGILFERARWRIRQGDDDVAELLAAAPANIASADAWWRMRALAAREALQQRNYAKALSVLQHVGELKKENMADALWLKGWILLRHRQQPGEAYKQFFKLYTTVSTPVSKARAAYWAGRAALANGNADIANEWFVKAARFPTVFYGQLAFAKLSDNAPLRLPKAPEPTSADKDAFAQSELVVLVRALAKAGDTERRDLFLTSLGMNDLTPGQHVLLAELARDIDGPNLGVEAAKLALRDGITLVDAGWPTIRIPDKLPIERALTLAITRQESEFNPTARSSANAQGLMQLLPSTAQHVADRIGLAYSPSDITDTTTNLTLGSTYLGQIINGFDGSYILGIASYNAGPANVRKWVAKFGPPPKKPEAAIDWIESIPFDETRNYVMRVLENTNVYRTIEDRNTPLALETDLIR